MNLRVMASHLAQFQRALRESHQEIQGYLAHKKMRPPRIYA